ncbi:MAG: hypothetical protein ACYCX0_11450 [Desulfurivibrionaceae bacterium]
MYGTVCTVVWEDGGGNPASYPIAGGNRVLKGVRLPPAIVVYGSRTGESQVVRFFG